jgi:transcriptional regulator with XRE-family HTH domain
MSEPDDLGVALVILRTVAGLSQVELGKAAGLQSATISDYERGKMKPGLPTAQRIVGSLGFSLGDFEEVQGFLRRLRNQRGAGEPRAPDSRAEELERVARQAGQTVTSLLRILLR